MLGLLVGIIIRIFSNSYLNIFQKLLTQRGEFSSVVNFYTYFGLAIIALICCHNLIFSVEILSTVLTMGFLGALGNFFIVKALSCGELSALAPINSYKPVFALIFGIFFLKEVPGLIELGGIALIIAGTCLLGSSKMFFNKATVYRFTALILLSTEAIFIKKVILLTDINSTFLYWVLSGLIFTFIFALLSKHSLKIEQQNIKFQIALIILVALMQYSTNYVFSKINVAYALALFQLSTVVSVFLGVNIFNEDKLVRKLIASLVMIFGAVIIILV